MIQKSQPASYRSENSNTKTSVDISLTQKPPCHPVSPGVWRWTALGSLTILQPYCIHTTGESHTFENFVKCMLRVQCKMVLQYLSLCKNLFHWPSNTTPRCLPKKNKIHVHTKTCTWRVIAALFIIIKKSGDNSIVCQLMNEWINKCGMSYNGVLFSYKKE